MGGSLIGISLLFGITAGAYASYEVLRPKNIGQYLEWKGYSLIKDDLVWDAVYEEYGGEFKEVQELKSYCSKALGKFELSELDRVIKYCVDEVRTVKGQLIREGISNKLIKTEQEYKLALVLRSSNKEFLEIVDSVAKYKEWCESNLSRKPNPNLITNVKTFCIPKPYKTASEKLAHEGFKRLDKDQLSVRYEELQISKLANNVGNTLLADISSNGNGLDLKKDVIKFTNAYWEYCEREAKRSLGDESFYPEGYSKFRARCADIGELKESWKRVEEIKKNNPLVQEISDFEKENTCNMYFVHKEYNDSNIVYYKAEDPIWIDLQKEYRFRHRDFYKEFKDFIDTDVAKKVCKEAKGKEILVRHDYWVSRWVIK
ncbi:hypothetical protein A6V39_01250 [Candidatus Mycoplasma haematobovis]|uniref:Uncharacterized protein n=1 Tax=Candidatus Mycoplasma haematobovis TaxID=432608 RepID=A0A1A9QG42_9MOLU|nr:hypothetical protein [Candidatus Mycoplasma haematobovis]OAL10680.1 hypothetical protein A6V39_01250 [Candidatus Mycoplasma haematobovis]